MSRPSRKRPPPAFQPGDPDLLRELCRIHHSNRGMMLCALLHGQVSIDGYVIRTKHLGQWTRDQLRGRMSLLVGRQARLYA